jgi:parallel beta-helix repeat protein
MDKKTLIIILTVFALLTMNACAAQESDNSTADVMEIASDDVPTLQVSNATETLQAAGVATHIDVESDTEFDVIGDYFKVKLSDENNNTLKNTKMTFTVNGKTYTQNTDSSGIASLQIRLNDGTYKIVTKFAGNANYKASSLTTTIKMTNTRVVDSGLSNSEIQSIIDNAKPNNVILFKGSSYLNINLVITKSLTLQSNVNTVLKSSSGPVITIKGKAASLTTVKGFNIQSGGDGIVVEDADYVKIYNNDISGSGNGIVATGTKYLNITKNDISKNSKSGISLADSTYAYIFDNDIKSNGGNGIEIAKSKNVYIHGNIISGNKNGVYMDKKVNGIDYGEEPSNIQINKNTITKNTNDGILVQHAGDNIKIQSNEISSNKGNGISLAHIGNNVIKSNVITENYVNGIKFFDNYVKPKSQDISYNAIYFNTHMDVEAKETYYQETGSRLELGDNWYTDHAGICPKIRSNNIKFVVKQIGPNQFQATFLDSNGNIASLLPDRTLTYKASNGQTYSITIKGGSGVFTVDAADGDKIRATVDYSNRDNTYDSNTKSTKPVNGQSPTYDYPSIPNYQLYEDIGTGGGNGNGDGSGDGSGGDATRGNGKSSQDSSSNGNATQSKRADPSSSASNPVNDVSQSADVPDAVSQAGASEPSSGDSGSPGSQSVVKQILIDEDEFFKVTGISFIILLIILTVAWYYREDISEMKSKM